MTSHASEAPRNVAESSRWQQSAIEIPGLILAVVLLAATWQIPLPRYFPGPGASLDFVKMLGPNWQAVTVQYVALVLLSFAAYGWAVWEAWRRRGNLSRWIVFGIPVLCSLVLLPMYPPTAMDLFHYHASSRVYWIHGANPLVVPPDTFPYPIGFSWSGTASPYGPLWSLLSGLVTWPTRDHYLLGLYGFKALAACSLFGSLVLVYLLAERRRPDDGALAVVLLGWNPFVLLRVVGDGHNDLFMVGFLLLALLLVERNRWNWAAVALACSVLMKFVTLLVVPLLLLHYWHVTDGPWKERVTKLAVAGSMMVITAAVVFAPFWAGLETFTAVREEGGKLITSTAVAIGVIITGHPESQPLEAGILIGLRLLFVVTAAQISWYARRDFASVSVGAFSILLLYLLVGTGWFRPWYFLWPVALACTMPRSYLPAMVLVLTFFGSFPDLVEQYRVAWGVPFGYTGQVLAPILVAFVPVAVCWGVGVATNGWGLGATRQTEAGST